ncbi:nad dependent epimerase/dehydratase, putative, partial [Perkinsus marinus ATCC 50983]
DPCFGKPYRELEAVAAGADETVLVTGGSGFIGSNLVEELLELGYKVRVLDNLVTGNIQYLPLDHPRLEFRYGDIMDLKTLRAAME